MLSLSHITDVAPAGLVWPSCALLALATVALYRSYSRPSIAFRATPAPAPLSAHTHTTPQEIKMVDRKMEENIAQFCGVTGASVKDAKKFLEKYKRVDVAVDAYYGDPTAFAAPAPAAHTGRTPHGPSTSKINAVFDKYKDPDSTDDSITVDGTIRLCEDLGVNPEDVVLLAVAYELKSPHVGEWGRAGWVEGWKAIGADTLPTMAAALPRLRTKLASDAAYFTKVYNHTFEFARAEGQRSIGIDTAQAFWALLLPHGMSGGAISHTATDGSGDVDMNGKHTAGFAPEHVDWWFEFLGTHGGKGVSKDTWVMFLDFVRTIDVRFETYDMEAAWPSTIDDFVEWAKERVAGGS